MNRTFIELKVLVFRGYVCIKSSVLSSDVFILAFPFHCVNSKNSVVYNWALYRRSFRTPP
jgi:hypothetical protein